MKKPTVCLNMIVKDESLVIRRCLDSVKGLIDYWVIVDTGSTDGTQAVITDYLQDIPGELHERPWKNFGHNRNEALELARGKADYFLFIDADDRLVFAEGFAMPDLELDCYCVVQQTSHSHTTRTQHIVLLAKDQPDLHWEGVLHEGLVAAAQKTSAVLQNVINEYLHDGHRSKDEDSYKKDVQMLEAALLQEPQNSRYVFYLAQSYASCGDAPAAMRYYEKRATMGGCEDEVFYSLYRIGLLQRSLKFPQETFQKSFSDAYRFRPSRAEPLFELAGSFIESGNYPLGYLVAKLAASIPLPSIDGLLIENWIYEWGALLQFYACALELKKFDEAHEAGQKLLTIKNLPSENRKTVEFYQHKMSIL
jgi:glycosyltransferase involved in cell wall biosynthesis